MTGDPLLRALGASRIVLVPFWLLQLAIWGRDAWLTGLPGGFWRPLPLALAWGGPLSPTAFAVLWWVAFFATLLVAIGLWTRTSTVLAAVSGAFLGSAVMSYGEPNTVS